MSKFLFKLFVYLKERLAVNRMFSGGNGTKEEPYLVSSVNDLIEIKNYSYSHFRQTQDIDLNGINWEPIPHFYGTYDGQNFKIKNLSINSNQLYIGLFGTCENATLKNIEIINAKVQGNATRAGILSGIINDSEVTNCHIIKSTVQGDNFGALSSSIYASTVSRCGIEQIDAQGYWGGGFAQYVSKSDINNCYVLGTVSGDRLATFVLDFSSGTIKNCYSVVNMIFNINRDTEIYAFTDNLDGVILSCYTDITVGITQVTWEPNVSYINEGAIIIRGTDWNLYQLIRTQPRRVGYAAQPVSGSKWREYWAPADIPEGRTTSQMMTKSNFVGWDFENVWEIKEGIDYPRLKKIKKSQSQTHCKAFIRQAGSLILTPVSD